MLPQPAPGPTDRIIIHQLIQSEKLIRQKRIQVSRSLYASPQCSHNSKEEGWGAAAPDIAWSAMDFSSKQDSSAPIH
jgi:hypothetical protein